MVRELLKERFSLTTHEETRVLPVYDLVLAKGGANSNPPTTAAPGSMPVALAFTSRAATTPSACSRANLRSRRAG